MNMPKISVIVPIYKAELYLCKCVDSILAQTYKNLEIILVDDGSPDNCGKICDEYAGKDGRVKVIHKQNAGVSAARNVGIDAAKGEWIGFVDSDDWIEQDMFEKLFDAVNGSGKQISVCAYVEHYDGDRIKKRICPEVPYIVSRMDALRYVLTEGYFEGFLWNKLFNRVLFANRRRLDTMLHICEDFIFVIETFLFTDGLIYISEALYHYCRREGSAINSFNEKRMTVLNALECMVQITSTVSNELARLSRIRYTSAVCNSIIDAVRFGGEKYLPALKKAARRYVTDYFFSKQVSFKNKVRGTAVMFFPKASNRIWLAIKKC